MIRRVIFSRSLRLLPLAEQVGAVEALAFIVKEARDVLPLSDQHLLAFLSELLKMSSVADGEMTDSALAVYVVDKNGNALAGKKPSASNGLRSERCPSHASAIFFRRECILELEKNKFVIPEELPHGIQLRVSSISLLHSVIIGHPNAFFDAEVSTPIGTLVEVDGPVILVAPRVSPLALVFSTQETYGLMSLVCYFAPLFPIP